MQLVYLLSWSQIWTHEQYLHSVGLWTKQQINSTGAVRAHLSLAAWHKILWLLLFSFHLFTHFSSLQNILSHEQMLYKLFTFISCHVTDIVCLGTLLCKVPDLATTSACEWCAESLLHCIHIHGSRTRGHRWCWDYWHEVWMNNRWWQKSVGPFGTSVNACEVWGSSCWSGPGSLEHFIGCMCQGHHLCCCIPVWRLVFLQLSLQHQCNTSLDGRVEALLKFHDNGKPSHVFSLFDKFFEFINLLIHRTLSLMVLAWLQLIYSVGAFM